MKKILAVVLAMMLVLGSFAGCAAKPGESTSEPDASSSDAVTKDPSELGVVMIVNTNLGDKSFCDLSNEGLQQAAREFGFRFKVVELNGDATKQIPTMTEFAEDPEWDIIIGGTYNILESMQTVAEEFPDKKFILYDAKDDLNLPNIYAVEHLQNEGSFIVGAAAALLTNSDAPLANKEKLIGFVAGSENTAINDFLVGYIQGAQAVDPEVKVLISYIGDFKDSAKAKEMAIAQINQGADVVFQVAGGAGLGVLDACKEKNVYAIGVDADQAVAFEETNPELSKIIATSMQKMVNNTVYNALKAAVEGTLPWGAYETAGLAQKSVGAAKNQYFDAIFSDEAQTKLDELEAKVASGEIKVETAVGMANDRLNEIRDSARP
ncbi:BMP family ABC transporter substrate-binding protein [Hydrogenoanaerobacterium sp.]|uniref:BMP family ABC transporter substrate-binding protein n=1 Tax=Hydrogenoanaerobacterium sp. TaxID=2953763 RepID=UPI002897CF4F|nr:BMP family ABC transporter substrate-binding protein [Hydrogenoanaerobacterium sp.]